MSISEPFQKVDSGYKGIGGEAIVIENITLNGAVRVAVPYPGIAKSVVIKALGAAVDLFNDAVDPDSYRLADGESIGFDAAKDRLEVLCYAKEVAGAATLQLLFLR